MFRKEGSLIAIIEIEDTQFEQMRAFQAMFDKIGKSKDRVALLKLIKEHYPDTIIPEIDVAKPFDERLQKIEAQLQDRDRQAAEDTAKRTIADFRRKFRQEGWDDEGIEKVEARMRETNNPDYESAAAWVQAQEPKGKPLPSTFAGQRFDWFRAPEASDDHKLLLKNPRAYQDAQVSKWLSEQGGPRRGWGNQ